MGIHSRNFDPLREIKKMAVPIKNVINRVNPRETNLLQLKNDQFRPRRIEQHIRHCDLVASDDAFFSKEY